MSTSLDRRVEEVFLKVVDLPHDRQMAEVARLCGGDSALREEVASLLGHAQPDKFLDTSEFPAMVEMLPTGIAAADSLDVALPAGRKIGAYTIVSQLGSGGMGMVYVAEQDKPRRTVALKLIRRGMALPSVLRRFEHEAEVLGRLQHPGIAQIYEAGTADWGYGLQPYLSMELVRGQTLTQFGDARNCSTADRLELVAQVCDAVQHAHQRGVIHRDLKPGNILVNAQGQVKVLDFGIARLTDADVHVTTLQTSIGQLIGTLPYMSPEQVGGDQAEVDTRSDVYALGVILYELLTGRLPHDVRSRPLPEAARVIRDESPTKLSSISKVFRGDVDTIVLKALEKNKGRRYQSAAELAADIRRYLAGEAIEAKRDSAMYVLRKQLKRYQGIVALAAAAVIVVVVLGLYAWVQAGREREARLLAEASTARAETATRQAGIALDGMRREKERADRELSISRIERARLLLSNGSTATAERILWDEYFTRPNDLFSRWAVWEFMMNVPCVRTRIAHDGTRMGSAVAVSPDGTRIVNDSGGRPTVWTSDLSDELFQIPAPGGSLAFLAYSPDGRSIAGGTSTGEVVVWSNQDGSELVRLCGPGSSIAGGDFTLDGTGVVAVSHDGALRVWDVPTGKLRGSVRATSGSAMSVSISPVDGTIATGGMDRMIRFWSPDTVLEQGELDTGIGQILGVCFSGDGKYIIASPSRNKPMAWAYPSAELVAEWTEVADDVPRYVVRGRNGTVILGGEAVCVHEVPSGRLLRKIVGDRSASFQGLAMNDGRYLVTSYGEVSLYEPEPMMGRQKLETPMRGYGLAFSPDGRLVASVGAAGLHIWEIGTGRLLVEMYKNVQIRSVAFSPDGRRFVLATTMGEVAVYDLATGEELWLKKAHPAAIVKVAWSIDGKTIASSAFDKKIVLLDAANGSRLAVAEGEAEAWDLAFSPDGKEIAVPVFRGPLRFMDAKTLSTLREIKERPSGWTVAYSPDSREVCWGSWGSAADVFDAVKGERRAVMEGHGHILVNATWSADGEMIATASVDRSVRLWDAATATTLAVLGGYGGEVTDIAFSPDGTWLATCGADSFVSVWDLTYYWHHQAGNVDPRSRSFTRRRGLPVDPRIIEAADEKVNERWPRWGRPVEATPGTGGVEPDIIAAWGVAKRGDGGGT